MTKFAAPKNKLANSPPQQAPARSRAQRKKHTTHWSSPFVDKAAQSTLQRALEVSKPEDEDEQEADAVASEVMRKEETASDASDASDNGDKSVSNGDHASNKKPTSGVWPSLSQSVTVRREATTQEAEELQREPEEEEEKDDTEGEALQRAVDGAAGSDDDEDKQAPLRGLGGGCASCGVQRKEEIEEEPDATTTDTAQAELVVGRADDPQEREADAVAERVMRMEDSEITEPSQSDDTLRRAPTSEEDEETTSAPLRGLGGGCTSCGVQRKEEDTVTDNERTDATPETVQAALVLGRTNDPQELEADAVAERVMRMRDADATSNDGDKLRRSPEEDELRNAPLRGLGGSGCSSCGAQRKPEDEDEKQESTSSSRRFKPIVLNPRDALNPPTQRRFKPVVLGGHKVPSSVSDSINELRRNGGTPLPRSVRQDFERRFRQDFSAVRIHTGEGPATVAQQLRAKAFTLGKDVVFGRGHYRPDTETGKRLLAHELAHVVQQGVGVGPAALRRKEVVPAASDEEETEASAVSGPEPVVEADPALGGTESAAGEGAVAGAATGGLSVDAVRQLEPPGRAPRAAGPVADAAAAGGGAMGAPSAEAVASAGDALQEAINSDPTAPQPAGGASPAGEQAAPAQGGIAKTLSEGSAPCDTSRATKYRGPVDKPPPSQEEKPQADPPAQQPQSSVTEDNQDLKEPHDCPVNEALKNKGGEKTVPKPEKQDSASPNELPAPGATAAAAAQATEEKSAELETDLSPIEQAILSAEAQRDAGVQSYETSTAEAASTLARVAPLHRGVRFASEGESNPAAMESASRTSDFFAGAATQFEDIIATSQTVVPEQVGAAAQVAKAQLGEAIEAQKLAISERIQAGRAQAFGAAGYARSQIVAQASSFVAEAAVQTAAGIGVLKKAHLAALKKTDGLEETTLSEINQIYIKGRADLINVGVVVGNEARACGQCFAHAYQAYRKDTPDSWWEGNLTDRRALAQMNTANEHSEKVQKSIEGGAKEQAIKVTQTGRRNNRCNVIAAARENRNALTQALDAGIAAMMANRDKAILNANRARDGMLASVNAALAGVLTQLDKQEQEQRQAVNDAGYLQQVLVEQAAHLAAAGLQRGVTDAINQAMVGFEAAHEELSSAPAPDPSVVESSLAQARADLDGTVAGMYASLEGGLGVAAGQLANIVVQGQSSLQGVTLASDELAATVVDGFQQAMGGIAGSAASTFGNMTSSFTGQVTSAAMAGANALLTTAGEFAKACKAEKDGSQQYIDDSAKGMAENLRNEVAKLHKDIPVHANEAASREPPAWKQVVAVVLVIVAVVIIIALIVVASVFTLGTATLVILGAVVGAVTAALFTIAGNLWSNQPWTEGVARAAATGFVTGLIGGGLGAWAGVALKAAGPILQFVGGTAVDLAFEAVTLFYEGGGTFSQFTAGNALQTVGFMVLGALLGAGVGAGVKRVRARGARPNAPHPHGTPDVPTTRPHGALEAPAPRPHGTPEAPTRPHGTPEAPSTTSHGTPEAPTRPHGTPEAPTRPHGTPEAPTRPHGTPEAPSATPARPGSAASPHPAAPDAGPTPRPSAETGAIPGHSKPDVDAPIAQKPKPDTPPDPPAARDASVETSKHVDSDKISNKQAANEADHLREHPEKIKGTSPDREGDLGGEHTWKEEGPEVCRHSGPVVCVPKSSRMDPLPDDGPGARPKAADADAEARAKAPDADAEAKAADVEAKPTQPEAESPAGGRPEPEIGPDGQPKWTAESHPSGLSEKDFIEQYKAGLKGDTEYSDAALREKYQSGRFKIEDNRLRAVDRKSYPAPAPENRAKYTTDKREPLATLTPEADTPTKIRTLDANGEIQKGSLTPSEGAKKHGQNLEDARAHRQRAEELSAEADKLRAAGRKAEADTADAQANQAKERADELTHEARLISEDLGEAAGQQFGQRFKAEGFEPQVGSGPRTFDQVYWKEGPPPQVRIIETKGGDSGLGTRFGADGTTRVEQGSAKYVEAVARDLELRGDKAMATRIRKALNAEPSQLQYFEVRQPINDGSLGPITAREFKL